MGGERFWHVILLVGLFAVANVFFAAPPTSLITILFIIVASSAMYFVLFLHFVMDEEDRETIKSIKSYFLSMVKRRRMPCKLDARSEFSSLLINFLT